MSAVERSLLMSPNSQFKVLRSEIKLSDGRNKMITSRDESLMSVATGVAGHAKDIYLPEGRCPGRGVAAASGGEDSRVKAPDWSPGASSGRRGDIDEASADACEDEATVPPNAREACAGKVRGSSGDDEAAAPRAGKGHDNECEKEAAAAESPSLPCDEDKEGAGRAVIPDATGGSMADRIEPARKRASANKHEVQASVTDSIVSTDSWGDGHGSLPPLLRPKCHTMLDLTPSSVALLEGGGENASNANKNDNKSCSGYSPAQDNATKGRLPSNDGDINFVGSDDLLSCGSNQGGDEEDHSQYINFNKLLQPSSSEYYYSQANRSNRKLIEKARSKKVQRGESLDESQHSRISVLSHRSSSASYRGPMPRLRNGSLVKSAMRKPAMRNYSCGTAMRLSPTVDSQLRREGSEGGDGKAGRTMKRCSFSSVDIREHERIAGDNPCVTSGVPLGIGWGYYQHDSIDINDYEINKGQSRDKIEMMIPAVIRKQMLREEFGVTVSEMNAAMREVNISKRQRRHSVATEHLEGWTEVAQSAKRKFKRFLKGTSTAKEQEKMWENARNSALKGYPKKNGDGSLGQNPEGAGVGQKGARPKIVPQNSSEGNSAPFLEISFQKGGAEGDAPTF